MLIVFRVNVLVVAALRWVDRETDLWSELVNNNSYSNCVSDGPGWALGRQQARQDRYISIVSSSHPIWSLQEEDHHNYNYRHFPHYNGTLPAIITIH